MEYESKAVKTVENQHDEYAPTKIDPNTIQLAEHVSYGPNGLRGLLSSNYVFWAAFLASLGGFSFGYDQGVMSIINVMPQFHHKIPQAESAFGKSFMTAMLQLGSFFGVLVFPWIADKISRKRAILLVVVIFTIGAILQTACETYAMLVIGRAIGGIGVGTLAMVSRSLSRRFDTAY
jgi:MFS family permease